MHRCRAVDHVELGYFLADEGQQVGRVLPANDAEVEALRVLSAALFKDSIDEEAGGGSRR